MVAVDSSTVIRHFRGETGTDIDRFHQALMAHDVVLPPAVIPEVLSDWELPDEHREFVLGLPLLPILDGYWVRAGDTRALILSKRLRAHLADTLIAQACIDNDVALVAHDPDFRHFAKHCGLKLA
jgi:predicted nucleic acid-binding protein